jgi:hypothetical protein
MEHYIEQIDAALRDEKSLVWIEDHIIDPAPLYAEQQAALWLYAWARQPLAELREATMQIAGTVPPLG